MLPIAAYQAYVRHSETVVAEKDDSETGRAPCGLKSPRFLSLLRNPLRGTKRPESQLLGRPRPLAILPDNVPFYRTLPAEFSRTTFERTAVSILSGRCE